MKLFAFLVLCIAYVPSIVRSKLLETGITASPCTEEECRIEDGCRCSSFQSPLSLDETPQLISLTFNEPITDELFTDYLMGLIFSRVNPDGERIGATFYIPHENTNYQRVRDLYILGLEVGVYSITNNDSEDYWRSATEQLLQQEFGGQKQIISKFANIPADDIRAVRTPKFRLAANATIQAYINSDLSYDSSWVTPLEQPFYPYTLDYLSTEECPEGSACPNEPFPKFWVNPVLKFSNGSEECIPLDDCCYSGNSTESVSWILSEVDRVRSTTKTPLTILVNTNWFVQIENGVEVFRNFLDGIESYSDVFLVSQKRLVDWLLNPVSLDNFSTEFSMKDVTCDDYFCEDLSYGEENRTLSSCVPCPEVYPWLGNPEGLQQ